MVEGAVSDLVAHLRAQLNGYIGVVYDDESDKTVNLPPVDRYYIAEGIEPLQLPAVFVVTDRSEHRLLVQNAAAQVHTVFVALVAEDLEVQRLQQKMWRYGRALWLALHDRSIGDGDAIVLVRGLDYGPTLRTVVQQAGQRAFRKDVVVRCEVQHYEAFALI